MNNKLFDNYLITNKQLQKMTINFSIYPSSDNELDINSYLFDIVFSNHIELDSKLYNLINITPSENKIIASIELSSVMIIIPHFVKTTLYKS